MEIPVLDINDKTQDKIENLSESGCLVVKNAISENTRENVGIDSKLKVFPKKDFKGLFI